MFLRFLSADGEDFCVHIKFKVMPLIWYACGHYMPLFTNEYTNTYTHSFIHPSINLSVVPSYPRLMHVIFSHTSWSIMLFSALSFNSSVSLLNNFAFWWKILNNFRHETNVCVCACMFMCCCWMVYQIYWDQQRTRTQILISVYKFFGVFLIDTLCPLFMCKLLNPENVHIYSKW